MKTINWSSIPRKTWEDEYLLRHTKFPKIEEPINDIEEEVVIDTNYEISSTDIKIWYNSIKFPDEFKFNDSFIAVENKNQELIYHPDINHLGAVTLMTFIIVTFVLKFDKKG